MDFWICPSCGGWGDPDTAVHLHPVNAPVVYKIPVGIDRSAYVMAATRAGLTRATYSPGPGQNIVINATRGGSPVRLVVTSPDEIA